MNNYILCSKCNKNNNFIEILRIRPNTDPKHGVQCEIDIFLKCVSCEQETFVDTKVSYFKLGV